MHSTADQALPFVYQASAQASAQASVQASAQPSAQPSAAHASSAVDYAKRHSEELATQLAKHGALLLRDFDVPDAATFQQLIRALAPELRNYLGGDSPRAAVTDKVYTSTEYPAALTISLHNEMSYTKEYPALIAFYCQTPPLEGGETPLADCRVVRRTLDPALLAKFASKKLRYVQNLSAGPGLGKSWQGTFETADRDEVEQLLKQRHAEFCWRDDGSLRTVEIVDPIVVHPRTGEEVFFSQAHMWHVSSLDARMRTALLKRMSEEDLYHHCTFGDGTPIAEEELDELRRVMAQASVKFAWRRHDVLVVDNVLVAHGRSPFKGERRILVAMG